jgi:hypothetical protein
MPAKNKVALAWLLREDWPQWQEIDPDLQPYERWLSKVEGLIAETAKIGVVAEKVVVRPNEFSAWCIAKGRSISSNSRSQYAAETLMQRAVGH